METNLSKLVEISNFFGKDSEYVIAGGGNTSYKDNNYIWIKASGISLANINESGFVKMDRKCLEIISGKKYSTAPLVRETEVKNDLYTCIAEKTSNRPSVETSLHNLLDFRYVVHTHPTLVNALMCSRQCRSQTSEIFGEKALLIEYTDPGYILFKLVEKKIEHYVSKYGDEPKIIFLQNHGVFVSSDSISEIKDIYREISGKITKRIKNSLPSTVLIKTGLTELAKLLGKEKNMVASAFQNELINEFTKDNVSFSRAATAFSPDNIVYCKAHYLFTRPELKILLNDYAVFQNKYGYPPKVIGIEGAGIICLEENEQSMMTIYEVFLDIMKISRYSENFGGPNFMTEEQIDFIDNWEVENYRRKIAKGN